MTDKKESYKEVFKARYDKLRNTKIFHIGRKFKLNKILQFIKFIINLIKWRGILRGELTSIEEILTGNFPNVEILNCENMRLSYTSPVFNDGLNKKMELTEGKEYLQYTLIIKNAIVYGDSNFINLSSKEILYDMPVFDKAKRYKFTDHNTRIKSIKENKALYWKGITCTLEKAIWMGGSYSGNYYHLLYEFVIKFLQLNSLDIPLNIPVLVDKVCLEVPQYKELLDIANKKGYQLIGINRKSRVKAGELIYISCPNFIPPNNTKDDNIRPDDMQFNISVLRDLRDYFLPYSSQRKFPKRIFISRKNASDRRKFNEDAVIQLFSEFGFEVILPETLSIPDQISLFNQAEWIAGGSGAAFTNLLFCNSGIKVILFLNSRCLTSTFSTIACTVNADLIYITEEDTNKNICFNNIHESFELNLSYLKSFLVEVGL